MRKFTAHFAFVLVLVLVLGVTTLAAAGKQSAPAAELGTVTSEAIQSIDAAQAPSDAFSAQIPDLDPKSGGLASLVAAVALAFVARQMAPRFARKLG